MLPYWIWKQKLTVTCGIYRQEIPPSRCTSPTQRKQAPSILWFQKAWQSPTPPTWPRVKTCCSILLPTSRISHLFSSMFSAASLFGLWSGFMKVVFGLAHAQHGWKNASASMKLDWKHLRTCTFSDKQPKMSQLEAGGVLVGLDLFPSDSLSSWTLSACLSLLLQTSTIHHHLLALTVQTQLTFHQYTQNTGLQVKLTIWLKPCWKYTLFLTLYVKVMNQIFMWEQQHLVWFLMSMLHRRWNISELC